MLVCIFFYFVVYVVRLWGKVSFFLFFCIFGILVFKILFGLFCFFCCFLENYFKKMVESGLNSGGFLNFFFEKLKWGMYDWCYCFVSKEMNS